MKTLSPMYKIQLRCYDLRRHQTAASVNELLSAVKSFFLSSVAASPTPNHAATGKADSGAVTLLRTLIQYSSWQVR